MIRLKYRKRMVLIMALLATFLYFRIVHFNGTMHRVFRFYDSYRQIILFIESWISGCSLVFSNMEDGQKLHFYAKPKFRFFGCIPVIVYGLYLISKAGFLWDLVLFELHLIAFMLIAAIDLWEERRNQKE